VGFEDPIFAPPLPEPPPPSRLRRSALGCLFACVLGAGCLLAGALIVAEALHAATGAFLQGCVSGCITGAIGGQPAGAHGASGAGATTVPGVLSPTPASSGNAGPSAGQGASASAHAVTQSASGVFADAFAQVFTELILQSWGIDRAAENARRLEWMAQGLREYERLHRRPPASLEELPISRDDLRDVFGTPIDYRVMGSPPHWEIRSAGLNRRFDDGDPWLAGP
jgi:hypothetical protein